MVVTHFILILFILNLFGTDAGLAIEKRSAKEFQAATECSSDIKEYCKKLGCRAVLSLLPQSCDCVCSDGQSSQVIGKKLVGR